MVGDTKVGAIRESIHQSAKKPAEGVNQSIYTPAVIHSEPPQHRAPSRVSMLLSAALIRSKGLIRIVLNIGVAQKRVRNKAYILEDEEVVLLSISLLLVLGISATEY